MHTKIPLLLSRRRLLIASLAVMFGIVICSVSPSCRPQPAGTTFDPSPPSLPAGMPAIRVRINDRTDNVTISTTGGYRLMADGKIVNESQQALAEASLRRDGRNWWIGNFHFTGQQVSLVSLGQGLVVHAGRPYRGSLLALPSADNERTFSVNNHVGLESYLAGVLARELLRNWDQEAYNALAIAARTYALFEMRNAGQRRDFDVYNDQRSQVYGGIQDETPKSLQAVRETWGQVMVTGPAGKEQLFKSYYSSCCGGITNPAAALEPQGTSVAPLSGGVQCDDCHASARYRWPALRLPKEQVLRALQQTYSAFGPCSTITEIRVVTATPWGRAIWLDIVTPEGPVRLRADDLRLCVLRGGIPGGSQLYSMNCQVRVDGNSIVFEHGRGFGHGVGLCQFGAQGKALRGLKGYEIVYSYFPGSRLILAY